MTNQVYYGPHLDDVAQGSHIELTGEEARHAHVKRTDIGELIDVVNGRGLRATIEVTSVTSSSLTGTAVEVVEEAPSLYPMTLVQALAKGGRDESAVEAAIEVGVQGIVPWQADRSIVKWAGPKAAKGVTKWEQVALAAMKQSRQAYLPTVSDVHTTKQLAQAIRSVVGGGGRVFICHEEATQRLAGIELTEPGPVWIVVGPEGGMAPAEVDLLVEAGGELVLLGDTVLRSGTAGSVAATVVQVTSGAWR